MPLNDVVRARIDENVKKNAEEIFGEIGITTSQAINIFFKKVISERGIPFELKVPTKRLEHSIKEAMEQKTVKYNDINEMIKDLKS